VWGRAWNMLCLANRAKSSMEDMSVVLREYVGIIFCTKIYFLFFILNPILLCTVPMGCG